MNGVRMWNVDTNIHGGTISILERGHSDDELLRFQSLNIVPDHLPQLSRSFKFE